MAYVRYGAITPHPKEHVINILKDSNELGFGAVTGVNIQLEDIAFVDDESYSIKSSWTHWINFQPCARLLDACCSSRLLKNLPSVLFILALVVFQCFNVFRGFHERVKDLSLFNAVMTVAHEVVWTFCFLSMYLIGIWKFTPACWDSLQKIVDSCLEAASDKKRIVNKIKAADNWTRTLFILALIGVTVLSIIRRIVALSFSYQDGIPTDILTLKDVSIGIAELFVLPTYRFMSLPFLSLCVFQAYLYSIRIHVFIDNLKTRNGEEDQAEILYKKYVSIHKDVKKTSKKLEAYTFLLFILLFLNGGIGLYLSLQEAKAIPHLKVKPDAHSKRLVEVILIFITFFTETVTLFIVPLYAFGKASSCQRKVIKTLLSFSCSRAEDGLF